MSALSEDKMDSPPDWLTRGRFLEATAVAGSALAISTAGSEAEAEAEAGEPAPEAAVTLRINGEVATVPVDGRRVDSCLTFTVMHDGAEVTTIEGLEQGGRLRPLQQAFIDRDAMQCRYCTPGQIMSGVGCITEGHTCGSRAPSRTAGSPRRRRHGRASAPASRRADTPETPRSPGPRLGPNADDPEFPLKGCPEHKLSTNSRDHIRHRRLAQPENRTRSAVSAAPSGPFRDINVALCK
jgi:hypothetical protein